MGNQLIKHEEHYKLENNRTFKNIIDSKWDTTAFTPGKPYKSLFIRYHDYGDGSGINVLTLHDDTGKLVQKAADRFVLFMKKEA